ncbi:MAG: hypothetical protein QM598_04215 [Protaetiibacter sp.]
MAEVNETLEGALAAALAHPSWDDTIDGVKSIMIRHLVGLHSGAEVRATNFFNHTFAPDITLSWPDTTQPERRVFLRFPDRPQLIADGIAHDLPEGSVVLGLGELEQRAEAPALAETSRARDTLVMDPRGLETLERSADDNRGRTVVTTAVTKGARGLFGATKVDQVASALSEGIEGAARADVDVTALAAETSQRDFTPRQAVSLEHLLQTYWIAGGASATEYPGQFQPGIKIGVDELRLLLDSLDIDDMPFWRSLGSDVSLETVFAVGSTSNPANLARLIRANIDRFTAKAAWVRLESRLREPDEPDFDWVLENDLLRLLGPDFSAYFARKKKRFATLSAQNRRQGVTPAALLERGQGLGIREVVLADDRSRIAFSTDDITEDARTADLAQSFGPDARIARAIATLPSGTHVTIDFEDSTAVAVTNSNPPLDGLAHTAVTALVELTDDHAAALAEFLELPPEIPSDELLAQAEFLQAIGFPPSDDLPSLLELEALPEDDEPA